MLLSTASKHFRRVYGAKQFSVEQAAVMGGV